MHVRLTSNHMIQVDMSHIGLALQCPYITKDKVNKNT